MTLHDRAIDALFTASRGRALRPLRAFAIESLVVHRGPRRGPFALDTQPYMALLLAELESGRWRRVFLTGPTQSGKTFLVQIPLMHALFERRVAVGFAAPDAKILADKYRQDVLPMIRAGGWESLLPQTGAGSQGGMPNLLEIPGAGSLTLLTGGGGDAARSSYTIAVMVVTEVDKMDSVGGTSREADKISQLEARMDAFGGRSLLIGECTPSTSRGRVWREIKAGTDSRIACPCPICRAWVTPEREHLQGWQDAETVVDAARLAHWVCPACGGRLGDQERATMNRAARLLHRGQRIENGNSEHDLSGENNRATSKGSLLASETTGEAAVMGQPILATGEADAANGARNYRRNYRIVGDAPKTNTLGFRWNAFNNLFWSTAIIAEWEWMARKDPDAENADKALKQFKWGLPYDPPKMDVTELTWLNVARRARHDLPRGVVPADAGYLTAGLDVHRWMLVWVLLAVSVDGSPHVVDYGIENVHSDELAEERAILTALRDWRDRAAGGWAVADSEGERRSPDIVFVDSGYQGREGQTYPVYSFARECAESDELSTRYFAAKGRGESQIERTYTEPKSVSDRVPEIGDGYYVTELTEQGIYLVECNADRWKIWVHARCRQPLTEPGALTLFAVDHERKHQKFGCQICAERQVQEFDQRKGDWVTKWVGEKAHMLDCTYMAAAAAHLAGGARLLETREEEGETSNTATAEPEPVEALPDQHGGITNVDGGPFVSSRSDW